MALTRPTTKSIKLGNSIKERLNVFVVQRNRIRDERETDFLSKVIDEGLGYNEQIAYRKEQIQAEKKSGTPDNSYIKEIKKEVSRLGQLKRDKAFRDSYRQSLEQVLINQKSYDDHINFLQRESDSAVDPSLRTEIQQKISDAQVTVFELHEQAITERAEFAQNDKSVSKLNKSIEEVKMKKSQAEAANNESATARWTTLLSTLESDVAGVRIENTYNDLEIQNMSKPLNSVDLLNFYKNNLKSASGSTAPIFVNGKKYENAQDYWQSTMNVYVSDTFFNSYQNELQNKIDVASKRLTPVLEAEMRVANQEIDRLFQTPELRPFAEQFQELRTNVNFVAAQKIGEKIFDDYNNGLLGVNATENFVNARTRLETLNKDFDVDVTQYLNTIVQDVSQKKGAVASEIARIVEEEGVTFEEASKRVKAVDIPDATVAEQDPTKTAEDIATTTPTPSKFDIKTPAPASEKTPKAEPTPTPASNVPEPEPTPTPEKTTFGSSKGFASIVDYLNAQKQDSSFQSRAKLFETKGLGTSSAYKGSAQQNVALLDVFRQDEEGNQ